MNLCKASDLKDLLDRHGFRFSKSLGQNFLIDSSVPERIANMSGVDKSFGVLEIGPGIGALSQYLCQYAGKVTAVELDKALPPLLQESMGQYDNFNLVIGDIMKTNIKELVTSQMPDMRYAVCANLPYNITTPVITAFIDAGVFESITVMIQREVARRICAKSGNDDYGAFTIMVQYYADTELLFDVPPSCFMPQPKVHSSVIKLTMRDKKAMDVKDEAMFFRTVRAAFAQRRKTLVNALSSGFSNDLTKQQIAQVLADCGLDEKVRGEKLTMGQFANISDVIGELL